MLPSRLWLQLVRKDVNQEILHLLSDLEVVSLYQSNSDHILKVGMVYQSSEALLMCHKTKGIHELKTPHEQILSLSELLQCLLDCC